MRLTDEQIRETVEHMLIDHRANGDGERLIRRAIANDPGARFVVYAAWRTGSNRRARP